MSIKTVWHWKSIGKAVSVVLLSGVIYGVICSVISAPENISFLGGMVVGALAFLWSANRWDMWHFE